MSHTRAPFDGGGAIWYLPGVDARQKVRDLQGQIERVIQGKSDVVRMTILALLARGHLLIEDVPGVGKTTLAHSLARSLGCSFKRIQFTSDLLPSDIIGVSVFNQQRNEFEFQPGPIFANIILADEINRTTPKTQSSLLEAMNDAQVSVDSRTYRLPRPFMVVATQNPLEYQGTYPLPESQLDRFLMRIGIGYPAEEDEKRILAGQGGAPIVDLRPALSVEEVLLLQDEATRVRVSEPVTDYLLAIVRATRSHPSLALGVSTRGAMALFRATQALAYLEGRDYCIPDDVKRLAPPVCSHRVILSTQIDTPSPSSETERILQQILEEVPVPL